MSRIDLVRKGRISVADETTIINGDHGDSRFSIELPVDATEYIIVANVRSTHLEIRFDQDTAGSCVRTVAALYRLGAKLQSLAMEVMVAEWSDKQAEDSGG